MDEIVEKIEKKPEIQFELKKKKKASKPRYSADEDRIIMDEAMKYPDNMSHGFSEAASKLENRSTSQVSSRYYYLVNTKKQKSVVMTVSKAGFSTNKVTKKINGNFKRQEPLKPLIVMFKQLLEMDDEARKKIKQFLESIE